MASTEVRLKTIADIASEKASFYIDAYQRGYRWTANEVEDLLGDIMDFSQSPYDGKGVKPDMFYCLQPVIITLNKDKTSWKVIDGQQRLTTLYLIYLYYVNTAGRRPVNIPYELHYNGKTLLEYCLTEISVKKFATSKETEDGLNGFLIDIDCYYVMAAYSRICDFFNSLAENPQKDYIIDDMKKVFDKYLKIIWYELVDCNESEERAMFAKVNMNKIPLTNAELIKALLLRSGENTLDTYQDNIAIKWDEIEAKLSQPSFWAFLVNDSDEEYPTRIDFIFKVLAHNINEAELKIHDEDPANIDDDKYYIGEEENRQYFSFYVLNNYARLIEKERKAKLVVGKDPGDTYIEIIWDKTKSYFQMFNDWYQRRCWYHMIGYLVSVSNSNYIDRIITLSKLYSLGEDGEEGFKSKFENNLRAEILKSIGDEKILISSKEELEAYVCNLRYDKSKKEDIIDILLLHNICTLEMLEKKTDSRFPFDKFKKDSKTKWDIEHINAVADDMPIDRFDRPENKCLIWLKNTKGIPDLPVGLKTDAGEDVTTLIDDIILNKKYISDGKENSPEFIRVYNAIINYYEDPAEVGIPDNSIGNLTLLDSTTNRSYKNDVFPLKRKKIIERMSEDVYIPLCTKNVFIKAQRGATDLLRWHRPDKEEYKAGIINTIAQYLIPEGIADAK